MVIDLPLTSWLPDSAALNNPGLVLAKNCTASIGLANGQVTYNPVNRAKLFLVLCCQSRHWASMSGRTNSRPRTFCRHAVGLAQIRYVISHMEERFSHQFSVFDHSGRSVEFHPVRRCCYRDQLQ